MKMALIVFGLWTLSITSLIFSFANLELNVRHPEWGPLQQQQRHQPLNYISQQEQKLISAHKALLLNQSSSCNEMNYVITSENPHIRRRVKELCGCSWQASYAQLHKRIMEQQSLSTGQKEEEKYLIYSCPLRSLCGGFGDR